MAHKSRAARRRNQLVRSQAEAKQSPISVDIQQARALENKANYAEANPTPPEYLQNNQARKPHLTPSPAGRKIPFFMLGMIARQMEWSNLKKARNSKGTMTRYRRRQHR